MLIVLHTLLKSHSIFTCKPLKELFESVIHSVKRYTYETIDLF